MNRQIFQISLSLILLGTMFISSLPSYPAYARPHNSRLEEKDLEGELTVEVINKSSLDEYLPREPFVLLFSESMQIGSSPQPLTITPPVEGQITWDEDAKHLTFEPIDGFIPDQTYIISLDPNITSSSGIQFDELQSWTIHIFAGPSLLSRSPESLFISSRFPIIRLTFDQEMDPDSLIHALVVEPDIEMDFGWGGRDFFIRSLTELDPDQQYHFTLTQGAMDIHGLHLRTSYKWTYTLEPVINNVTYPTSNERLSVVSIEFNYGVMWESLHGNLSIDPEITGQWIQDKEDGTRIKFVPDANFNSDVLYTIRFNGTLLDLRGSELPTPEPISFQSPPALLRTAPEHGEIGVLRRDIILNFDRRMDEYLTEAALSFDPPLEGDFYWEQYPYEVDSTSSSSSEGIDDTRMGAAMIFVPNPDTLAWMTEYTGTLAVTARDAEGNPILQEPFQWSFTTGAPENAYDGRFGYWGANIQILDTDGPRAIQFELDKSELDKLEFSLHALTPNQFLERFKASPERKSWINIPKIDLDGIDEILRWTNETADRSDSVGEVRLPYDLPCGFYVFNLIDGEFDFIVDQIFVVLTKNSLLVKQSDGQIVTWVTDIDGQSRGGVLVQIYDMEGSSLDSGYTDEIGVYRSQFSMTDVPFLVMARDGDDLSISGLDRIWTERGSYWSWITSHESETVDYGIHVYTDRPIYRPGQTVFYKTIIRQDDDGMISLPYQGVPVLARIRDSRDNLVQEFELSTNSFGTAHGEFILSDGAMVGDYTIEVEALSKSVVQIFKVQDYKKPDLQAILESDADSYVEGDEIHLTLKADYLFGKPVNDAEVNLHMYDLVPYSWWYWGYEEENDKYVWTPGGSVTRDLLKIEDGILEYAIPAQIDDEGLSVSYHSNLKQRTVAIEATIEDGSGETISTYKIVKIYSANNEIHLNPGDYFKKPNKSFMVTASAFTISGEPLRIYPLQLIISRYVRESGKYDEPVLNINLITGEDGMASEILSLEETGAYMFELVGTDDKGNQINYKHWAYVFDEDNSWASDLSKEIRILADRSTYAAGETAHLVIESTFDGTALLAVERGTTRRVKQVLLTSPFTEVDLEILETDSPNIFVSISAYTDEVSSISELPDLDDYYYMESLVESQLHQDVVELTIPPTDKSLTITITPDKETYVPRDQAQFTIEVTDANGHPVSGELSLALVDEAIFSLSDDLSLPLVDAFYAPRQNGVQTFNSMGARRWIKTFQGGGGGGGGPSLPGTPRSDFPDTAAWIPVLWTDAAGRADLTLSLPDTLTTWRLTAKAVTKDTKVGETEIRFLTTQDVVIRPLIPRTLTEGDEVILSAVIHNYDESLRTFDVYLMNTFFEVIDPIHQSLSIKSGEEGKISWRVKANKPGEAVIRMIADDGDMGDAVQVTISVQKRTIPELASQAGEFQGQLSTIVELPETYLDQSWVQIELNRSIAGSILTGLEYLTGFPYGCVEQTMSRALPNAMVGRAFYQLGLGTRPEFSDLPEKINAGLQRLYGYQHIDGGWGWWHDDASHAYQTAWVVYGLAMTVDAGYLVDPEVIQRGAVWLSRNLDEMDDRMKAYALYSMAIAGSGDVDETLELIQKADQLDTFSIAALGLTLHELDEHELALRLVNMLERTAIVQENIVYWSLSGQDNDINRRSMASSVRDTALALSAFVKISPNHPYETGIVRWLMDQRGSHGWGDTHQNSYAILALTDHLIASGYAADTTGYTVLFNGREYASGSLDPQTPSAVIKISSDNLLSGENSIEIKQDGVGQMYYVINRWFYRDEAEIDQAGNILIERKYHFLSGREITHEASIGQMVRVDLEVNAPQNGSFIILEDQLPGGFEALNESLSITSRELTSWGEPRFAWEQNGYNQKEIRADRVTFFFTELEKGTHTISYLARIHHNGIFTAMPAQAWAMYDNTFWGRSSSAMIEIEE